MNNDRISRWDQVKVYTGKCFRIFFYEKGWKILISSALISAILAWVIGEKTFTILNNTKSGMFAMVCGCIWIGLFNSIQSVCKERDIIKREHRTGLHISAYVIAHMIYEFVICVLEGLILTVILPIFRELPDQGVVFPHILPEFFVEFTLTIFCADMLGLMVSSIVRTPNAAMTVMPFVLILQLVMSGMLFQLEGNAKKVEYLTISKFGLEALCSTSDINELPDAITQKKVDEAKKNHVKFDTWKDIVDDQEYLDEFEADKSHITRVWMILFGYSLLYGAIAVGSLEFIDHDKR